MNCDYHLHRDSAGTCRNCNRPICAECQRESEGVIYCYRCADALFYDNQGNVTRTNSARPGRMKAVEIVVVATSVTVIAIFGLLVALQIVALVLHKG